MIERWVTEARCELLHKAAHARTIQLTSQLASHDVLVIWCSECDYVRARRLHGHEISMREDFVSNSLQESCEKMADKLADLLPIDKANTVRIIGSRAELAEHNRRKAERRLARWQGLAVLCALAALCLFLSGCLTAQKALVWSNAVTAWGTKPSASQECKSASLDAAKYLSNANRHIGNATGLSDLPSHSEARRLMDDAAKKCEEKY